MKKCVLLMAGVLVLVSLLFWMVPSSQAQTKEDKQFMKLHEKEMATFMEKCSGCHSLQRFFAKEEVQGGMGQDPQDDGGKPHANISDEELKRIQKWVDFMQASQTVDIGDFQSTKMKDNQGTQHGYLKKHCRGGRKQKYW